MTVTDRPSTSDRNILRSGESLVNDVARISRSSRLEEHDLGLFISCGSVFDATRDDHIFSRSHIDDPVSELDPKSALPNDKHLLAIVMKMPGEDSLNLHDLDLLTVQARDNLRPPMFGKGREFLADVSLLHHLSAPSNIRTDLQTAIAPRVGMMLAVLALAGCATVQKPPEISYDDAIPAAQTAEPPAPVRVVEMPKPLPLPGQLKPVGKDGKPEPEPADPAARVNQANAAARVQPVRNGFINSMQVYPFVDGALYQVYSSPGQITDIGLQPGEQLVGSGPVAAGDTVRWVIGDTESGTGAAKQVHILVKPTRADLMTNLVINTDRRTYHMELRSTPFTYMASVSWQYPQDQLIALRRQNQQAEVARPVANGIDLANVNFRYEVTGDRAPWRPLRAFDDGKQVFIEFPRGIGQGEMPPLFVVSPEGDTSELVNYRVRGNYMIVDRLFAAAELRFGSDKNQKRVRISRSDGRPAS